MRGLISILFVMALCVSSPALAGPPPPPGGGIGGGQRPGPPPGGVEGSTETEEPGIAITYSNRIWSWFGSDYITGTGSTNAVRADLYPIAFELGAYSPGGAFYVGMDFLSTFGLEVAEVGGFHFWALFPTFGANFIVGDNLTGVGANATVTGLRVTQCDYGICLMAEFRIPTFDYLVNMDLLDEAQNLDGARDENGDIEEYESASPQGWAWGTSLRLGIFF